MKSVLLSFRGLVGVAAVAAALMVAAGPSYADFTREDVAFDADGVTLRGWLYLPSAAEGPVPAVVMAHGWSAVKEMYLDKYGEIIADAGIAALVYDNRNFGDSDGMPRQEIDPWAQVRDYQHAISYVRSRDEIDPERIGIFGSSYSGGHVLVVGAIDPRVKAVVSQVPATHLFKAFQRNVREDVWELLMQSLVGDREARYAGEEPGMLPVVNEDPAGPATLPQPESYRWFMQAAERAPNWKNEVTMQSLAMALSYEPWVFVKRISPTPLLMLVAANDNLVPTDLALETYEMALEPKELIITPGDHFLAYVENFDTTGPATRDWFVEHLLD